MTEKVWTDDMGEISGFGGSYEAGCRAMVMAGIKWLDEHPDANPRIQGYQGVYGLVNADNDDAKALEKAMMDAEITISGMHEGKPFRVGDDCTGAMHHAAMQHCLAYQKLGWDEYCRQLRERGK